MTERTSTMDMCSSFAQMLQVFSVAMTVPTHANLVELITGWVFAPRRTVIGMLRAGGTERHHSAFHRMFANAKWSVDAVMLFWLMAQYHISQNKRHIALCHRCN